MNTVGVVLGAAGTLAVLVGGAWTTIQTADDRYQEKGEYVTAAEFKNVEWGVLRREIREYEDLCEADPEGESDRACVDYEDSVARFCLAFPEDRLCRE